MNTINHLPLPYCQILCACLFFSFFKQYDPLNSALSCIFYLFIYFVSTLEISFENMKQIETVGKTWHSSTCMREHLKSKHLDVALSKTTINMSVHCITLM